MLLIKTLYFPLTSLLAWRFDLCSPPVENLCHLWRSHLSPHCTSVGKIITLQMKLCSLCWLMFKALSLLPSCSLSLSLSTIGRVNRSVLTSYLQDSCLSNAKSIAQHQGEVRARLTIVESYLIAHLPVL